MFSIILQLAVGMILFLLINYGTYWFTEKNDPPEWLYYKPFICRKCCFFWTSIVIFTSIGLFTNFNYLYLLIFGYAITILNTIALYVDDKNKFVEID